MRVGNHRSIYGFPGVDEEVPRGAVKPPFRCLQEHPRRSDQVVVSWRGSPIDQVPDPLPHLAQGPHADLNRGNDDAGIDSRARIPDQGHRREDPDVNAGKVQSRSVGRNQAETNGRSARPWTWNWDSPPHSHAHRVGPAAGEGALRTKAEPIRCIPGERLVANRGRAKSASSGRRSGPDLPLGGRCCIRGCKRAGRSRRPAARRRGGAEARVQQPRPTAPSGPRDRSNRRRGAPTAQEPTPSPVASGSRPRASRPRRCPRGHTAPQYRSSRGPGAGPQARAPPATHAADPRGG